MSEQQLAISTGCRISCRLTVAHVATAWEKLGGKCGEIGDFQLCILVSERLHFRLPVHREDYARRAVIRFGFAPI